ncbi:MAG: hypothetical protein A3J97_01735 [Spirochaetes bacterium RIFOXYC1_FULL_54_7]|nr:MAG: hypothetical protein A3J97_01735 [Spirochaetes bacterium RIFOXYC1_FULL_54_7]
MRTPDDYKRLSTELSLDFELLDKLAGKHAKAVVRAKLSPEDDLGWAAVGYTIHNIYCLFENYFLRIAKFFENGLDPSSWHAELVGRMCIEVSGLRPRLFDPAFAQRIDTLRRFRHAFRNMYQGELDPRRLGILNDDLPGILEDFKVWHEKFTVALSYIAASLENPAD